MRHLDKIKAIGSGASGVLAPVAKSAGNVALKAIGGAVDVAAKLPVKAVMSKLSSPKAQRQEVALVAPAPTPPALRDQKISAPKIETKLQPLASPPTPLRKKLMIAGLAGAFASGLLFVSKLASPKVIGAAVGGGFFGNAAGKIAGKGIGAGATAAGVGVGVGSAGYGIGKGIGAAKDNSKK